VRRICLLLFFRGSCREKVSPSVIFLVFRISSFHTHASHFCSAVLLETCAPPPLYVNFTGEVLSDLFPVESWFPFQAFRLGFSYIPISGLVIGCDTWSISFYSVASFCYSSPVVDPPQNLRCASPPCFLPLTAKDPFLLQQSFIFTVFDSFLLQDYHVPFSRVSPPPLQLLPVTIEVGRPPYLPVFFWRFLESSFSNVYVPPLVFDFKEGALFPPPLPSSVNPRIEPRTSFDEPFKRRRNFLFFFLFHGTPSLFSLGRIVVLPFFDLKVTLGASPNFSSSTWLRDPPQPSRGMP